MPTRLRKRSVPGSPPTNPDPECTSTQDCSDYDVCIDGVCQAMPADYTCTYNDDCPGVTVCKNGDCWKVDCTEDSDCDDGDDCTINTCNTVTGTCVFPLDPDCEAACETDSQCDDDDPCTDDSCQLGKCENIQIQNCCTTDENCMDDDPCTYDYCSEYCSEYGYCKYTPIVNCYPDAECDFPNDPFCDDDDPCTLDTCQFGKCENVEIQDCSACAVNMDCDDGDPCTEDLCLSNLCLNNPIPNCCTSDDACDDENPCTNDYCIDGGCQHYETCIAGKKTCEDDSDCEGSGFGDFCVEQVNVIEDGNKAIFKICQNCIKGTETGCAENNNMICKSEIIAEENYGPIPHNYCDYKQCFDWLSNEMSSTSLLPGNIIIARYTINNYYEKIEISSFQIGIEHSSNVTVGGFVISNMYYDKLPATVNFDPETGKVEFIFDENIILPPDSGIELIISAQVATSPSDYISTWADNCGSPVAGGILTF